MQNEKTDYYTSHYGFRITHIMSSDISKAYFSDWHYDIGYVLAYFKKAAGKIKIEGSLYPIADGDMVLLNYNEVHSVELLSQPGERITLYINTDMFSQYPAEVNRLLSIFYDRSAGIGNHISNNEVHDLKADLLLSSALEELSGQTEISDLLAFTKIVELLHVLRQKTSRAEPTSNGKLADPHIKQLLKYINQNFLFDITMDMVAKETGISKYYMCRLFKEAMGISLWDYVINRRILYFNEMIRGGIPIECAAFESGFHNYSNFYRLYKKRMNMSPTEYKKKCRVQ